MKISVLTPTYNRAHTLPNLYKSLIVNKKACPDIEWLIMDDGSTDNTEKLIKGWIKEKKIEIKYFKQQNQGKMTALNNLLQHIEGEITIECDSDDYFTDNCFKEVFKKWDSIKDDDGIYGLALLKITKDNNLIGNEFPRDGRVSRVFDMYFKEGITGDKCFIFKSEIRKKFKHKFEHHERFTTEGRMYHEMDLKYNGLKCFNIRAMVCEYLGDGYSKKILDLFKQNPYGYYQYYLEMFKFNMKGISLKKRLHIIKHYILFSCLIRKSKSEVISNVSGTLNKLIVILLVVPGYIITKKRLN